ncbi:FeoB-associated Cys-rich membrane protein [Pseudomonas sp. NPDC008258]|uniref:FeoB-associated Cys-rich membrane protein n=1 Tax=Pseudomonas sp. NPDC008258 TaxID=3364418 RepID=UPI0036E0B98A
MSLIVQYLIVVLIVAFAARRLWQRLRPARAGACGDGCGSCSSGCSTASVNLAHEQTPPCERIPVFVVQEHGEGIKALDEG